jgi:hypothetical protein
VTFVYITWLYITWPRMAYVNMAAVLTGTQLILVILTWHLCTSRNFCLHRVPGSDVICEQIWRLCVPDRNFILFWQHGIVYIKVKSEGQVPPHNINKRHVTVIILSRSLVLRNAIFVYIRHVVKSHHVNKTTWLNSLNVRLSGHLHPHNTNKCHLI